MTETEARQKAANLTFLTQEPHTPYRKHRMGPSGWAVRRETVSSVVRVRFDRPCVWCGSAGACGHARVGVLM